MTGEHEQETRDIAKARRQWSLGSALIVSGAIGAVLLAGFMSYRSVDLSGQRDVAVEQVRTEQDRKNEYVDRALALCDPADEVALARLRAVGLCDLAQEDRDKPAATQQAAPDVSFSQVLAAVQAYFAANPPKDGKTPSRDELLALTEQVYRSNPPEPGRTPSRDELLALVREVYEENPPAPGKDGTNGVDGKPGVDGRDGAPGPGVLGVDLVPRDGRCFFVVTFEARADGTVKPPFEREVNQQFCEPPGPGDPLLPGN